MADPITLGTLATAGMAMSMAGSTIAAGGQVAGGLLAGKAGKAQRAASEVEAQQIDQNAATELAAGQRRMFERQFITKQTIAASRARAGASGVDPGTGSALENEGALAERGELQALTELFNGDLAATGLRNKAAAVRHQGAMAEYEGKAKRTLSYISAAGTLASGFGSAASNYGKLTYPTPRGSFGA